MIVHSFRFSQLQLFVIEFMFMRFVLAQHNASKDVVGILL